MACENLGGKHGQSAGSTVFAAFAPSVAAAFQSAPAAAHQLQGAFTVISRCWPTCTLNTHVQIHVPSEAAIVFSAAAATTSEQHQSQSQLIRSSKAKQQHSRPAAAAARAAALSQQQTVAAAAVTAALESGATARASDDRLAPESHPGARQQRASPAASRCHANPGQQAQGQQGLPQKRRTMRTCDSKREGFPAKNRVNQLQSQRRSGSGARARASGLHLRAIQERGSSEPIRPPSRCPAKPEQQAQGQRGLPPKRRKRCAPLIQRGRIPMQIKGRGPPPPAKSAICKPRAASRQ